MWYFARAPASTEATTARPAGAKKTAVRRAANVPLRGIAPSRWSDLIDLPLKKQVHYLLPHACRANSPTICARPAGAKKIRRQAQLTNYLTHVGRTARRYAHSQREQKKPPSGGTICRDSGYLTPVARSAQRQAHSQSPKERYRAAIRWFCQGEAEGVNLCSRPRLSPPTRPAGASKIAPLFLKHEINGAHHA